MCGVVYTTNCVVVCSKLEMAEKRHENPTYTGSGFVMRILNISVSNIIMSLVVLSDIFQATLNYILCYILRFLYVYSSPRIAFIF